LSGDLTSVFHRFFSIAHFLYQRSMLTFFSVFLIIAIIVEIIFPL
jgi:hypothetical protein